MCYADLDVMTGMPYKDEHPPSSSTLHNTLNAHKCAVEFVVHNTSYTICKYIERKLARDSFRIVRYAIMLGLARIRSLNTLHYIL